MWVTVTNDSGRLWDSEAAALLSLVPDHGRLLQTVVETARAIFGAAASSIFLLDPAREDLVFAAVSGRGEGHLVGTRVSAEEGLVGWVMAAGQPIAVDDAGEDPRFARATAEATGYVPRSILAAPLLAGGEPIGVIEVLDRTADPRGNLTDLEILGLFAGQAAIGLQMLRRAWLADARSDTRDDARAGSVGDGGDLAFGRVLRLLRSCDEQQLTKVLAVVEAVIGD